MMDSVHQPIFRNQRFTISRYVKISCSLPRESVTILGQGNILSVMLRFMLSQIVLKNCELKKTTKSRKPDFKSRARLHSPRATSKPPHRRGQQKTVTGVNHGGTSRHEQARVRAKSGIEPRHMAAPAQRTDYPLHVPFPSFVPFFSRGCTNLAGDEGNNLLGGDGHLVTPLLIFIFSLST